MLTRLPMRGRAVAAVAAGGLVFCLAGSGQAPASVAGCRDAIAKQGEKFFRKKISLWQRCEKLVLAGTVAPPCPDAGTAAKIQKVEERKDEKIQRKCDGVNPLVLGWPGVCPAPCSGIATTTIDGVVQCVDCVVGDRVDQLVGFYCPDSAPEPDRGTRRCKQTIGRLATRCVNMVVRQLNRCEALVREGELAGPCPDAGAADKIQKVEDRRGRAILNACSDHDPQSDLGFGSQCPDAGGVCGGILIDTLGGLLECIDCLSDAAADDVVAILTAWASAPLVCGDGVVNQPGEECDPPDDSACPGECRSDCTCPPPPACGDGVVNRPGEECDPPDDSACPGQCRAICACPLPPGSDDLLCQRAIEQGGMLYAEELLQAIESCAAPGESASIQSCLASQAVQDRLDTVRAQWGTDAAAECDATNVHGDLGYLATCAAAPSSCTFSSAVLDAPGASNDLLDCLACRISEELGETGQVLFADRPESGQCHGTLGRGGIGLIRTLLGQIGDCLTQPGATSIAACFQPDEAVWRAQAENDCSGIDPFTDMGYPDLCSGVEPLAPGWCAKHTPPCTFVRMSELSTNGADNDLLDCLTCRVEEAALGVARLLYGANLCCVAGACDAVLSRFACREAKGTPVHYRVDTLSSSEPLTAVHGFDVRPDGTLYVASHTGEMKKVAPDGTVSVIGAADPFVTGVAVDGSGKIYYTVRCKHQVFEMTPSGEVSVFAGTGVPGHSGDGGAATAAQIVAPDGITIDAAGNVYFTESGLLAIACRDGPVASERVRMVDTSGNIHTVAGSTYGTSGAGGPATDAELAIPYSLWRAFDGSLLIGENGAMRVLRLGAGGILTHVAGRAQSPVGSHSGYGGPALPARFYHTCGLGADPDGNVIVGVMENGRVALVDRLGSVIGIAGTGEGSDSSDPAGDGGPATLARGLCCEELEVSADARIFCSDLSARRIRVLWRERF